MKLVVSITGASGLPLADTFLKKLISIKDDYFEELYLVVSDNAVKVAAAEGLEMNLDEYSTSFNIYLSSDFSAPFASGSYDFMGMVIIPASMSSIGAIASGYGQNLIHRCADVCLKERKKLILVPRETPLSSIHLENMLKIRQAGGDILPFIPSFYNKPESIKEMMDYFSVRILDSLGIRLTDSHRWK